MTPESRNGSVKPSGLKKEVEVIIERTIQNQFCQRKVVTIKDIHYLITTLILDINRNREVGEKLLIPSYSTVYQRVIAFGQNNIGEVATKKGYRINYSKLDSQYPMQKAFVVHVKLDIKVVDETTDLPLGSPWLTLIIDCFSMYPLGMYIHFDEPSYKTVMLALKHAIVPKEIQNSYPSIKNEWHAYGLPETLAVTNAWGFRSNLLSQTCLQLNVNLEHCPMVPKIRGKMEQPFKTFNELLSQKTHHITFKSLQRLIHVWLLDNYSENYNTNVKGVPAVIWRENMKNTPKIMPSSMKDTLLLFMEECNATITNNGIRHLGLTYVSPELLKLSVKLERWGQDKKVIFKYDPTDLAKIHVYDEYEKRFLEVPSTNLEYTKNVTLHSHIVFLKDLQKKKVDQVFKNTNKKLTVITGRGYKQK
ncbi:Mu transposase C-terminal domain-containing protein [Bacillus suaedaesalsae]|uniref:Mu transposase C-terminal domain-containing protein n=1 Tax=Bacillus suaedaesalsae TaxID=2810349 RepID=A0ABS2DFR1_9BACI|nr:Mu transposase C-terminal domain-containing protein [Bacillus suaedaesalsae]MBM6617290.1 Mu transposase C-terminal domain-containing protein [Bacillus suaedaesalsae]